MKTLYSIISSTRTMAILLLIFGVSIGVATFIENDFGTDAARSVVYNAKWFELLMVAGMINIIAVTIKKKMYIRSRLTLLLFHMAFVVIIIGAGITRYFGTEGAMYIREGQTENTFLTANTYVSIWVKHDEDSLSYSRPVLFSNLSRNRFKKKFNIDGHAVSVLLKQFVEKAEQTLKPDPAGSPYAELVSAGQGNRENLLVKPGTVIHLNTSLISFTEHAESSLKQGQVNLFVNSSGNLSFIAPYPVYRTTMATQTTDTLAAGIAHPFLPLTLHNFDGSPLVLKQFLQAGTVVVVPVDDRNARLPSALVMEVTIDGINQEMTVFGMKDDTGTPVYTDVNGTDVFLSYGSVKRELPFGVHLYDFIIKRYPGSESPSWFESRVQLIDQHKGLHRDQRIYMNNILKYEGYRLYQSSYDKDEHGSILAVNHDGLGTRITYFGYLCLALGFILSLLNRKSRFAWLWKTASTSGKAIRILLAGAILTSFTTALSAQDPQTSQDSVTNFHNDFNDMGNSLPVIDAQLAREFDTVLVQDVSGRIEPVNTLASEILRKVVRKERYKDQSPSQIMLGMLSFPQYWLNEKMIMVNHPEIQRQLGLEGKYASFIDFFDSSGTYMLGQDVEDAYRKKPAYRSKYDNELIRTDERLNICNMIYTESALKIFPVPDDTAHKWQTPVSAKGAYTTDDSIFAEHVLEYLYTEIRKSTSTHNWELPVQLVRGIKKFQNQYGKDIIPSQTHIRAEIFYNNSNLFIYVMRIYMMVGFILLIIQFIHMFFPGFNLKFFSIPAFIVILLTFLAHMSGLALRWYIAGHAPWSNGYEALTFIAWATVLAGLIFSRKSSITLSATAILASLILMVAHMSWMDPQITNLVPVLKSYWLVIHVADITASYGFLGLGALLAAVNLLLMFFQTSGNSHRIEPNVNQITLIIEMTLTVGLYMLTIGTFLGGVWANESWGRYWGWDPKETWALTTAIVYAVILHLRLVPGFKGRVLFNILALAGFGSVVMTYFGVNYYLSGLHSYAKGDPMPVPPVVYYSMVTVVILSSLAAWNQVQLSRKSESKG